MRFHTHVCARFLVWSSSATLLLPSNVFFFLAVLAAERLHQYRSPRSSSPPTYLPVSLHACRPRGYVYTRVYARYACTSLETLIFREIISLRKAVSVPRCLTAAAENLLESRQSDEAKELEASETAFMLVTHMYRCHNFGPRYRIERYIDRSG